MTKCSLLPVEEIYTNVDVNKSVQSDAHIGYTFNYPPQWLDSPSHDKMIGVRRLKLVPSTHSFDVCFRIYESPEAFNPDEIQWNDYEEFYATETYDERPLNWFEGDYSDIGPIFIDSNRKLNMLLTYF